MKERRDRPPLSLFFLLAIMFFAGAVNSTSAEMQAAQVELPQSVGSWTKSAGPRTVTAENIFEYMDGAGELYVGFRFDCLEVTEYEAPGERNILVELYFMKTPDDAFGLLSLDWGGEPADLEAGDRQDGGEHAAWPHALYGEGLLRLRSDTIYARIMAEQETPRSKEAVMALGRTVVKDRPVSPEPTLLGRLPETVGPGWNLRRERTSYFRSHLVLNSLYFLSHENMFELGHETEAVFAIYEKDTPAGRRQIRILLIQYPDAPAAESALGHFQRIYLPDRSTSLPDGPNFISVEDGWLGYKLTGTRAAYVFECSDEKTAAAVMDQL